MSFFEQQDRIDHLTILLKLHDLDDYRIGVTSGLTRIKGRPENRLSVWRKGTMNPLRVYSDYGDDEQGVVAVEQFVHQLIAEKNAVDD